MHVLVVSYILPIIFPNTTTGLTNVFPGMYTQNKQFCVTELHCIWLQRNVIHPLSLGAVGEGRGSMWNIESKMKTHGLAACPRHWQKQHRNNNNSKIKKKPKKSQQHCVLIVTVFELTLLWQHTGFSFPPVIARAVENQKELLRQLTSAASCFWSRASLSFSSMKRRRMLFWFLYSLLTC